MGSRSLAQTHIIKCVPCIDFQPLLNIDLNYTSSGDIYIDALFAISITSTLAIN